MTKEHFIALADFIKDHNQKVDSGLSPGCSKFDIHHVHLLADFCERQNPRFNRERWLGYIRGENGPSGGKVT